MESDNASLQRQIDDLRVEIAAAKCAVDLPRRKERGASSVAVLAGALLVGSVLGNALATGISVSPPRPQPQTNTQPPPKNTQPAQQNSGNQSNNKSPNNQWVQAPFAVHDKAGNPLFAVEESGEVVVFGKHGQIHFNQDSRLGVRFQANSGQEAELGEGPGGPLGLRFRSHEKTIAILGVNNNGRGALALYGGSGSNPDVELDDGQDGPIGLKFRNNDKAIAILGVNNGGLGSLVLYDGSGSNPDVVLKSTSEGGYVSTLADSKELTAMKPGKTGGGEIATYMHGDEIAGLGADAQGGLVEIWDEHHSDPVAYMNTDGTGGIFRVLKGGDTKTYVAMGATSTDLGLKVRDGGKLKALLGVGDGAVPVVAVYGTTDKPSAAMETYDNGKGEVAVFDTTGDAIVSLSQSSTGGGGNLKVGDPKGNGVFSAGYSASDGADVCLDRKNHLWCMGINLPLQMTK
jgi:hypothetical protein